MSIVAQQITYIHPDKNVLFRDLYITANKGQKMALVGNNGSGKSTLLRILAGELKAQEGEIRTSSRPYYVPQHFGQYNHQTIAEALQVDAKLNALQAITAGDASAQNFAILDDDWEIEEKCLSALSAWGLEHFPLNRQMNTLSGGEKTKVFLAGIFIHSPSILLMDEPTNHLDRHSREQLYGFIQSTRATLLIVSHDRTLLNLLPSICELTKNGITTYGGNYDFYKEQKEIIQNGLQEKLGEKEKELRLARKTAREIAERKQKQDIRGKKTNEKKGIPRIAMKTLKDQAEKSTSRLKNTQEEKAGTLVEDIGQLRSTLINTQSMKMNFSSSTLHTGKIVVTAEDVNYKYDNNEACTWHSSLNFQIRSGDRIAIKGDNGSGKTTLLKLVTGQLDPTEGRLTRADLKYTYIDQDYSIIQNLLTVYEQAQAFNKRHFREDEIKMLLNRYLFPFGTWEKTCQSLSGGEKMRLVFCCLMISDQAPDLFILDEPTNNLDLQSVEITTAVIKDYRGTILVVSHDSLFINEIGIERCIELDYVK